MGRRRSPNYDSGMTEPASLVAIDGPVASGKTVVGRELARRLDWGLFDTGIMYRALTWLAFRELVELDDEVGLAALAQAAEIKLRRGDDALNPDVQVMIEGENVTEHLRALGCRGGGVDGCGGRGGPT